jgi:hypothetical protein
MKKILYLSLILMVPGILIHACQEEKVIVQIPAEFEVQEVNIPGEISTTSAKPVLLTAKVTHPQGNAGIKQVICVIIDSTGQDSLSLEMFDDGDALGNSSGDIIAFDQIYTVTIIGTQLMLPQGIYQVQIFAQANSGENVRSFNQNLEIFPNQAPEIVNYFFPDTISLKMPSTEVQFTVFDNDGLNDIRWVVMQGFEPGNAFPVFRDTIPNPQNNSPLFTMTIDSSYAAAKKDDYELQIFAEDRVNDKSPEVIHPLFIENSAPQLLNISVPDTMLIFQTSSNIDTVRAEVKDGQSLLDVKRVYFVSQIRQANGSLGPESDPIDLFDNGDIVQSGDPVATDGEYSRIIRIDPENTPGTYIFTFHSQDFVDQFSTTLVDSIEVIQN